MPEAPLEQCVHGHSLVFSKDIKITMSDNKAIQASLAKIVTEMRATGAATSHQMDDVAERLEALSKTLDKHKLQNDAKFASQRELIVILANDIGPERQ